MKGRRGKYLWDENPEGEAGEDVSKGTSQRMEHGEDSGRVGGKLEQNIMINVYKNAILKLSNFSSTFKY